MRIAADGYIDCRDGRRVRTPGPSSGSEVEPLPEREAIAFLLSHSFPGHRRIVRGLTEGERRQIRLAQWADSVSERMSLVDRVWRSITEPVAPPPKRGEPHLVQIVQYGSVGVSAGPRRIGHAGPASRWGSDRGDELAFEAGISNGAQNRID